MPRRTVRGRQPRGPAVGGELRGHFTAGGVAKFAYTTRAKALTQAAIQGMHVYKCPVCSKYHLATP